MEPENDFLDDLFRPKHVYAFYVPSLEVIKIGFGDNAHNRMVNYCKTYGLKPDHSTLRAWQMSASAVASTIESAIHRGLPKAGFTRYKLMTRNGEAQELFALNGKHYEEAFLYVTELIDVVSDKLASSLKNGHVDEEKSRQKQRAIKEKQRKMNEDIKQRKDAIAQAKQDALNKEWAIGWETYIKPWYVLITKAKKISTSYKRPGLIYKAFKGDDWFPHYINWEGYPHLLKMLPSLFAASRNARAFIAQLRKKYGHMEPTGWEVHFPGKPGGWRTNSYDYELGLLSGCHYRNERGIYYMEVSELFMSVFGLGSEHAERVMMHETRLVSGLIEMAKASPLLAEM